MDASTVAYAASHYSLQLWSVPDRTVISTPSSTTPAKDGTQQKYSTAGLRH